MMDKQALHADDRLKERTTLSPEVLTRLRRQVLRRRLPRGTHHVRLGTEGYAVLKDVGGRHVVATVLSRHMRPPGKELRFAKVAQPAAPQRDRASRVPLAVVSFPSADLQVRVARDPTDLVAGLSGIRTLPSNTGMLFVLPEEGPAYFWMRRTHIPLDIALLDANMRVRSIHTMEPETGEARDSGPIKYAVETNAGWFRRNGVRVGDQASLPVGKVMG